MKILIYLFSAILLLTGVHCASVPPNSVKMTSRWDETAFRPIKSVYVKVNDIGNSEEDMYVAVIKGFKKSLREEEVSVREYFTGDNPATLPDSTKVDAILVLGKPFQDIWKGPDVPVPGAPPGLGYMRTSSKRQRFIIQLVDPNTQSEIWVGEVSFEKQNAGYVGNKVVRQWVAAGLLPLIK